MTPPPTPGDGAKMMFLIRRRDTVSREELVAHWFANHMPGVIAAQQQARESKRLHAWRYIATLFDADQAGNHPWDGVAQLWWDRALPKPDAPFGEPARDTFQEKAEPYWPWATTEYVVIDGELPVVPNTLNDPFPCTRSGFLKVTYLVKANPGTDFQTFFAHWLDVHTANVANVMHEVGGIRYVASLSQNPEQEPYAGMAELYFADAAGWQAFQQALPLDGTERWLDRQGTLILESHTEMIGIP